MRLGVRAHDLGRHDPAGLAFAVQSAGFECVQLAPAKAIEGIHQISELTLAHMEEIRAAFACANVGIEVLGCYVEPAHADADIRKNDIANFIRNLDFAAHIGCGIVGTETTNMVIGRPSVDREAAYARLLDSVQRMVWHAEKVGVCVGIEPVVRHTLNTPELAARLHDDVGSDKLKFIFDPVNMLMPDTIASQDKIFRDVLNTIGEHICVMHIKSMAKESTAAGKMLWSPLDDGAVSYESVFAWLKARKPGIALLREEARLEFAARDIAELMRLIG